MPLSQLSGQQLGAASVKGYRELLRKLRAQAQTQAQTEESPREVFLQARERVRLQLASKRAGREGLDPQRAFHRLREQLLDAQTNIRELKVAKAERLRSAMEAMRRQGLAGVQRALPDAELAASAAQQAQQEDGVATRAAVQRSAAEQAVLGQDGLFRSAVLATAGAACKAFMLGLSRTSVEGLEHFQAALDRPSGQALITVSNHVASMDDPLVTAALVPAGYLLRPAALRWTMCATDRCFKSETLGKFFTAAKVLPVERGAGLAQPGMTAAEARLAAGDWVHIFPEGTRSTDGRLGRVRKGVGRLVAACQEPPLVLPFVHAGMEKVIPRGSSLPSPGQKIRVLVGESIQMADLVEVAREQGWSHDRLYTAIADRVGEAMYTLKAQLEGVEVADVVQSSTSMVADDDSLLPLIEDEMDSMQHPWGHRLRDTIGLASISSRVQSLAQRQLDSMSAAAASLACQLSSPSQSLAQRLDSLSASATSLACQLTSAPVPALDAAIGSMPGHLQSMPSGIDLDSAAESQGMEALSSAQRPAPRPTLWGMTRSVSAAEATRSLSAALPTTSLSSSSITANMVDDGSLLQLTSLQLPYSRTDAKQALAAYAAQRAAAAQMMLAPQPALAASMSMDA